MSLTLTIVSLSIAELSGGTSWALEASCWCVPMLDLSSLPTMTFMDVTLSRSRYEMFSTMLWLQVSVIVLFSACEQGRSALPSICHASDGRHSMCSRIIRGWCFQWSLEHCQLWFELTGSCCHAGKSSKSKVVNLDQILFVCRTSSWEVAKSSWQKGRRPSLQNFWLLDSASSVMRWSSWSNTYLECWRQHWEYSGSLEDPSWGRLRLACSFPGPTLL